MEKLGNETNAPARSPEVMTSEEAARFLALPDTRSLNRLVRLGRIPYVDGIGLGRRFLRESLLDVLRRSEVRPNAGGGEGA